MSHDSCSYQCKSDLTLSPLNLSSNKGNILLLTLLALREAQKDMYDKHKIWITAGSN